MSSRKRAVIVLWPWPELGRGPRRVPTPPQCPRAWGLSRRRARAASTTPLVFFARRSVPGPREHGARWPEVRRRAASPQVPVEVLQAPRCGSASHSSPSSSTSSRDPSVLSTARRARAAPSGPRPRPGGRSRRVDGGDGSTLRRARAAQVPPALRPTSACPTQVPSRRATSCRRTCTASPLPVGYEKSFGAICISHRSFWWSASTAPNSLADWTNRFGNECSITGI